MLRLTFSESQVVTRRDGVESAVEDNRTPRRRTRPRWQGCTAYRRPRQGCGTPFPAPEEEGIVPDPPHLFTFVPDSGIPPDLEAALSTQCGGPFVSTLHAAAAGEHLEVVEDLRLLKAGTNPRKSRIGRTARRNRWQWPMGIPSVQNYCRTYDPFNGFGITDGGCVRSLGLVPVWAIFGPTSRKSKRNHHIAPVAALAICGIEVGKDIEEHGKRRVHSIMRFQPYQWGCDRRVIAINALFALPVYSRLRHGRVPGEPDNSKNGLN
ncbi:hypothetical protein V8E53_015853 [Lactarius tabidus]